MKKYIAASLIFLCLGAFSWAQGAKTTLFDVVKSQQELEIMKQILGTTLSFVAQNLQKQQDWTRQVNTPFGSFSSRDTYRFANINAFYLYGQGAVFVLPSSNLRFANLTINNRLGGESDSMKAELMNLLGRQKELDARALASGVSGGGAAGAAATAPPPPQAVPPKPPTPPSPPTPAAKPAQGSQEALRKQLAEAQDRVKKSREDTEANRAKFMATLGEVKSFLIEALATHGDSLATVKPNEYITLVIMLDDFGDSTWLAADGAGMRAHQDIVSVQKSWITDYKAGRLTLEAFKQKVLQYIQ